MESLAPTSAPDLLIDRLSALAEPARLRLLALLEREELGVTELAEVVRMPQSSVSRHLKQLADGGWVASRSQRTANLYRMRTDELEPRARQLWELAREEAAAWPAFAQDRLRLRRHLERKRERGSEFFAGVAGDWDRLRRDLYGDVFTHTALHALLPRDWVVADLACGTGVLAAELAPCVARVVAVDQSEAMLAAARERLAGASNVELRLGDLEALPLPAASCDAALLLLALTHVAEPPLALAELRRVLRPGGRAVVVDLLRHDRDELHREMGQLRPGFEREELAGLLAAAGLAGVVCRGLPPEPAAKGPALLLATAERPLTDLPVPITSTSSTTPRVPRGKEKTPR